MYVTDSLFFLQHLIGGGEKDENRQMLGAKYREIMEELYHPHEDPKAEDIKERMIDKSMRLVSGEDL